MSGSCSGGVRELLSPLACAVAVLSSMRATCLRTLESLQARALRICLGLPRCTSTSGTIEESRTYPIQVYTSCEPLRVHLRLLTRHAQHPLSSLQVDRPGCTYSRCLDTHRHMIPSGFAPAVIPAVPPWTLTKPLVCLHIRGISYKSHVSYIALKQLTLAHLDDRYSDSVQATPMDP